MREPLRRAHVLTSGEAWNSESLLGWNYAGGEVWNQEAKPPFKETGKGVPNAGTGDSGARHKWLDQSPQEPALEPDSELHHGPPQRLYRLWFDVRRYSKMGCVTQKEAELRVF